MASGTDTTSFNPWTLLDRNDPGDVIGKAKSKQDETTTKKPVPWAPASKAMEASTPAKKKKNKNKKKPTAAAPNQANNGKGPAGKQNGAGKGSKNGGASREATSTGVSERR
ncbi:unnamed protein product [Urochloa humidicola]